RPVATASTGSAPGAGGRATSRNPAAPRSARPPGGRGVPPPRDAYAPPTAPRDVRRYSGSLHVGSSSTASIPRPAADRSTTPRLVGLLTRSSTTRRRAAAVPPARAPG